MNNSLSGTQLGPQRLAFSLYAQTVKLMQVPVLTDGVVTLSRFDLADSSAHLAAEDAETIRWLQGGERSTIDTVTSWVESRQQSWDASGPYRLFAIRLNSSNEGVRGG